ncbi:N-acetyltransferase GCN5 [Marasmius fiardii PR-910]|nr:N-acetyltransferase GCN5 [Marasmius fiardii PR-910]
MSLSESSTLPPGYTLVEFPPPLEAYLELRRISGLSPKNHTQGEGALSGSWRFCTVVHQVQDQDQDQSEPDVSVVAMGRVIGDGGWYFVVADIAVHPSHRRRGLGEAVLRRLIAQIKEEAPPGALVTLSADEMGRGLYRRCGFVESAPESIGMWLNL